jgi:hypothetical protein
MIDAVRYLVGNGIKWRPSRLLDARRALLDPAQDRLATFQAITPGHPLIPPRDPEIGQRADKVTTRSSGPSLSK